MAATDILQQIGESLGSSATVKAVFGEPVHARRGEDCDSGGQSRVWIRRRFWNRAWEKRIR